MRKPRHLVPDARYHVSARANRQEMVLAGNSMKELFLQTVSRAKKKLPFRLENFCVLGNHFHFVICPSRGVSLSRIMQWILGTFAVLWNKRRGVTGHVWGDRFKSRVIASLADWLNVHRYIDQNPVAAGLCLRPEDWPYGAAAERNRGSPGLADPLPIW